jgi:hypothetical protein
MSGMDQLVNRPAPPELYMRGEIAADSRAEVLLQLAHLHLLQVLAESAVESSRFARENQLSLQDLGFHHNNLQLNGRAAIARPIDAETPVATDLFVRMFNNEGVRPEADLAIWLLFEASHDTRNAYLEASGLRAHLEHMPAAAQFILDTRIRPSIEHSDMHIDNIFEEVSAQIASCCEDLADGVY